MTLIDAGTPFASGRLLDGLRAMGKDPGDIRRIVLTHSHYDHAGSAARIAHGTGARVIVHAEDAAYARRGRPPTPDVRYVVTRLFGIPVNQAFPGVEVDEEIKDGDVLPIAGGLRVVHTPGHTPGHVSLLLESSGILITGDTILNVGGLRGLPAYVSHDFPLYQRTRHMLGELDYTMAAFTHGPEMRDRPRERIRAWLRKRPVLDR